MITLVGSSYTTEYICQNLLTRSPIIGVFRCICKLYLCIAQKKPRLFSVSCQSSKCFLCNSNYGVFKGEYTTIQDMVPAYVWT